METTKNITPTSKRKMIWKNIIFFAITSFGAFVGAPIYFMQQGISAGLIALTALYLVATGLAITVGYHRHYSHQTFKTNKFVEFILLFFGAAAFEQTAYKWSAQHRDHHTHVDTDSDPYNIKKGFWYAHMGWLVQWEHQSNYASVKDLAKNKLVMNQNKYYGIWALGAGLVVPVLVGASMGQALGAFLFAVCVRITAVYHSTFFINSVCHMFGKPTYDIHSTAKDHWFVAFLTYGEGYHNFHHRFPSDYRNAVRWYQWDPSKWTIALLEKIGMASDLRRVSDFKILNARISAENKRVYETVAISNPSSNQLEQALAVLKDQYAAIRSCLTQWEAATREYKTVMADRMTHKSDELIHSAQDRLEVAKKQFAKTHKHWKSLVEQKPVALPAMLLRLSV